MSRTRLIRSATAVAFVASICAAGGCGAETDAERLTAAWILEHEGQVRINVDGKEMELSDEVGLPDGPIHVVGVAWDIYPGDRNPRVTDAELAQLEQLPHLKSLDLWASKISDAGLVHLAKLAVLERLILTDTNVGDAGLGEIERLKSLKELSLIDTKATKDGIAKLQRALPKCRIRR